MPLKYRGAKPPRTTKTFGWNDPIYPREYKGTWNGVETPDDKKSTPPWAGLTAEEAYWIGHSDGVESARKAQNSLEELKNPIQS